VRWAMPLPLSHLGHLQLLRWLSACYTPLRQPFASANNCTPSSTPDCKQAPPPTACPHALCSAAPPASPPARPASHNGCKASSQEQTAGEQLQHVVVELAPGVVASSML
jgi:hypothetical protein